MKGGNEYLMDCFCFVFDINCVFFIIGLGVEGVDYEVFDIGYMFFEQVYMYDVIYYKFVQLFLVFVIYV